MYGNFVTRSIKAISYMILQPQNGLRWIVNRVNRNSAIELCLPWISYPSIDYLRSVLQPDLKVFEWGTGGSTLFFAKYNCKVSSVESNDVWLEKVTNKLNEIKPKYAPKIYFVPAENKDPLIIKDYVTKIRNGAPWDIVLVDGLYVDYTSRVDCILEAKGLLNNGGMIILDDSYFYEYVEVPQILKNFKRLEFWGLGPARLGLTKTDIYINLSYQ